MIKINLKQLGDFMTLDISPMVRSYGESKIMDLPDEKGSHAIAVYSYKIPWTIVVKDEKKGVDERICGICRCTIL